MYRFTYEVSDNEILQPLVKVAKDKFDNKEYESSVPLWEIAYEKMKEILGEEHKDSITCLTMVATAVSCDTGYDYAKREFDCYLKEVKLRERALELSRLVLDHDDMDYEILAIRMNNLALAYCKIEEFEKALELQNTVVSWHYEEIEGYSPDGGVLLDEQRYMRKKLEEQKEKFRNAVHSPKHTKFRMAENYVRKFY